jgi:hypothetical protein
MFTLEADHPHEPFSTGVEENVFQSLGIWFEGIKKRHWDVWIHGYMDGQDFACLLQLWD